MQGSSHLVRNKIFQGVTCKRFLHEHYFIYEFNIIFTLLRVFLGHKNLQRDKLRRKRSLTNSYNMVKLEGHQKLEGEGKIVKYQQNNNQMNTDHKMI